MYIKKVSQYGSLHIFQQMHKLNLPSGVQNLADSKVSMEHSDPAIYLVIIKYDVELPLIEFR
jgi:hypothetical protein